MPSHAPSLESIYIQYTDPCIYPTNKQLTLTYVLLSVNDSYNSTSINSYEMIRTTSTDSCVIQKRFLSQNSSLVNILFPKAVHILLHTNILP